MAYKFRTGRIKPECGAILAEGTQGTLTAWGGGSIFSRRPSTPGATVPAL